MHLYGQFAYQTLIKPTLSQSELCMGNGYGGIYLFIYTCLWGIKDFYQKIHESSNHMDDRINCNSVRGPLRTNPIYIYISSALFVAFWSVQSQNGCGISSPFWLKLCNFNSSGFNACQLLRLKPLSIGNEWCYRNHKFDWTLSIRYIVLFLREMTKQISTTIVWPKFTIEQANCSYSYLCSLFTFASNFLSSYIEKNTTSFFY